MAEEREKFFNQREEAPAISRPLENSSTMIELQRSPVVFQRTTIESSRPTITTEQHPPPYHIAAAYSKQAAYFQIRTENAATTLSPQKPVSATAPAKEVFISADIALSPEQKISDHKGR
jgi:hypothetical protein